MSRLRVVLLVALATLGCLAAGAPKPANAGEGGPGTLIEDVAGRVVHVRADWWGLEPDGEEGTRYAPEELPEEFRVDGLAVVFSGRIGEIPPNVRLWGTPLTLTEIRRADEE